MHLAQFSIFVCLWTIVICLDFDDVKETFACERIPLAKQQDPAWLQDPGPWYMPLVNKGELYKNAYHMFGPDKFAKLTEKDLQNSCLVFTENGTYIPGTGFGGLPINYKGFAHPLITGITYFSLPSEKERELAVTGYITKTDNKRYTIGTTIWEEDYLKGAYVFSKTPKLDQSILKLAKKHLTDLGFNPKLLVEINYDNCPSVNSFNFN